MEGDQSVSTPVHEAGSIDDVADLRWFTPSFIATQVLGFLAIILVGIWMGNYAGGGGFAWQDNPRLEFNYHPLFMIIGLVYLYGNAIMMYRVFRNERKRQLKLAHMATHIMAFLFAVVALKAVFDSHNLNSPPIPNLYSVHSWLGLSTVILFCMQFLGGFITFLYPGLKSSLRAAAMPFHVFFGLTIFILAVATSLMGITEKILFQDASRNKTTTPPYNSYTSEGMVVNFLGVTLVLLAIMVTYIVTNPNYRRRPLPEDELLLLTSSGH